MKGILLSIKPKYASMILNKDKTIEIRRRFPKDYVGWVYIYCTKDKDYDLFREREFARYTTYFRHNRKFHSKRLRQEPLNSKVVARFWCDKVEETHIYTKNNKDNALLKNSCLTVNEFMNYLGNKPYGYAIHITNLKIFDKSKDIKEFRRYCDKHFSWWTNRCLDCKAYTPDTDIEDYCNKNKLALTKAPQSWCYVEV